jgi:hypothetical protein
VLKQFFLPHQPSAGQQYQQQRQAKKAMAISGKAEIESLEKF